jgi:uncharacterized protein DUF5671/uncharacterized protein DUF3842
MSSVRRWYIYLVSAISLQGVAWAIIALLRNLLLSRLNPPPTAIAFEIAVILIGLPVFLVHWLWGQRLAAAVEQERTATLRRFYLYGTMAAFLGPFTANTFDMLGTVLSVRSTVERRPHDLTSGDAIVYHIIALIVAGVLWFYHRRVVTGDAVPEKGSLATVRRLYVFGFSAAGLILTTMANVYLLRWIMMQFGGADAIGDSSLGAGLATEITRLVVGVPLWLVFWRWAQRLFNSPSEAERGSVLRKVYLYAVVFIGALGAVFNASLILASLLRALLGLPSKGDIRFPLSLIVGMAVLWAYHAFAIRDDAAKAGAAPRQEGVRRLYLYLIAGIGLAALLAGLGGDVSVVIRSLGEGFGSELREQLAWFTAALIAGLPVWILPWRQVQDSALARDAPGADARRSIVRKIYIYLFLFLATMAVLSGAVFIVFKVLSWFLGADAPTLNELGHAIAFSLIAVGVWLYHGSLLRSDSRLSSQEQIRQLVSMNVAVVDTGDGRLSHAIVEALKKEMPALELEPILLPAAGAAAHDTEDIAARLARAALIVGPWTIGVPGGGEGAAPPDVARAVANSAARKLLIPTRPEGWEWAGVDRWDAADLVDQTVRAIKQIADGEETKPVRPMNAGTIISIVIGVLFLLSVLASAIIEIINL